MKYLIQSTDENILKHAECGGAVSALFKYLLDKEIVDGVLALKKGEDVYDGIPTLVKNSEELIETCGSLHCAPTNFGNIISKHLNDLKLAVAVKPCDAMAINELQKRQQIDKDNIYTIGLNCGGTIPPITARKMIEMFYGVNPEDVIKEEIDSGKFIIELKDGTHKAIKMHDLEDKGFGRRKNCQRCELKIPRNADLACGNWGAEDGWTFVEACSEKGKELIENAEKEGYIMVKTPSEKGIKIRGKIEKIMIGLAKSAQKEQLEEKYYSPEKWKEYWSRCIKCYGCRDACPLCFCKECALSQDYMDKGEIPPDPIMFQGIRLSHMSFSCINCGQCEDVCPIEIPVAHIYHRTQLKIRKTTNFIPGVDDSMPFLYQ
ncbi:coenzyme F420 hydrogenase/dehydrogenase beta subunit domain protein [Methanococcus aeolicus Nankai-3]|jgi:formate dehydrogenase subunit beta|uniref:formate dehydrogenase (coenzyme F420) n=1 Tax=Methanococcus aeolicus (strain ATCC BAA-1280 / DSM 17508 / OCM 812 / Nankai-3) TaxID=419665 RepID=A6UUJ0_META3|nr:Coenzyme F420 hydrogenase/dehydrogenase, beta subunit C-terminal domain [Methanococcus aeolicus]ABR56162.1 coenzyme F420 hydrogenase/dehydrogenase beta subunit domain protein [Methanococcus aeolicus Nankai-3]